MNEKGVYMKIFPKMFLLTAAALMAFFPAFGDLNEQQLAQDVSVEPRKLIAIVNDFKVYQDELDAYTLILQDTKADSIEDIELLKSLILQFAAQEALAQEAIKRGLDKQPDYIASIAMFSRLFLEDVLLEDMVKKRDISDEQMKEEYARNVTVYEGRRYDFSHIVVRTEVEAKQLIAAINREEISFSDAAKNYSLDFETASNGGRHKSLLRPPMINPSVRNALSEMDIESMSANPVESDQGYHIIFLNNYQDFKAPDYESLDETSLFELARPGFLEYRYGLQERMQVKMIDSDE